MHRLLLWIFLVCLQGLFITACTSDESTMNSVRIDDLRNSSSPPDYGEPQPQDVYVQRTIVLGPGYDILFFPEQNGELKEYGVFYGTEDDFDVAYYKWVSDTDLEIRLVNSESETSAEFVVYGEGRKMGFRGDE